MLNRFVGLTLAAIAAFGTAATTAAPAFALGDCGPNHHRSSVTGRCIWGGQDEHWCLRHTGHPAVRTHGGIWVCYR
jgi:hypothetical protein